jgi:hypothetical protein
MKRALSFLCFILVCWSLIGISPQFLVQGNPLEFQRTNAILITPENISRSLEPQIISLRLINTENASRGYPPSCSLILHEANLDSFNFTLRLVTTALFWQSENVEAWLNVDGQGLVKLDRTALDKKTGLALVGAIFTSDYYSSLSGLSEGYHTVMIRVLSPPDYDISYLAVNGSNPLDHFYFENSVLYGIDITNPSIGNISIKDTINFKNDLELNCTIDEPFSWIAYCLDNQANVTILTNPQYDYAFDKTSNGTIQVSTNLTNITEGSHSLTIYAKDTAGNTGISQTVTFTVIRLEPYIIIAVVSTGIAAIIVLLVRKRRRKIPPL